MPEWAKRRMKMEWIDRYQQMPKHNEVVVAIKHCGYELPFIGMFITGRGFVELATQISHDVTHWMALPPYPTTK